jgi:tryptophan synthase alpha chain
VSGATNLLEATFARLRDERRCALMPYFCLGYPDLPTSLECVRAAAHAGADVIELGIPFTDPIADGPTLQAASAQALARGATLGRILDALPGLLDDLSGPRVAPVLMTYYNPVVRMGDAGFAERAARAGVAAVIVPDLPFGEGDSTLERALADQGLLRVHLAAPTTTDERLAAIGQAAKGFLYLVSTTGITGARQSLDQDLPELVARARRHTRAPLCVGFGIARAETARRVAQLADGVIVGSALVDCIREAAPGGAPAQVAAVQRFVGELASAIRTS